MIDELDLQEACRRLGISLRWVHHLIESGKLTVRQDPDGHRKIWVTAAEFERYERVHARFGRDDARRDLRARMRRGET